MVGTVEMQVASETFREAVLSTLRRSPRCLPPASQGWQLQRIRFNHAELRNAETASFQIFQDRGPWGQGLGYEWITAKQAQVAIGVTLDLAAVATIAATPNQLVASEVAVDATAILDLTCEPGASPAALVITYQLSGVDAAVQALPGGQSAQDWLRDQLGKYLVIPPLPLDFSDSIPPNRHFLNAGIALDGARLVVRAELTGHHPARWENFYNGHDSPDRLGTNAWSIFLRSADVELTLQTRAWDALNGALKDEKHRLVTVACHYATQPGRAVFSVVPYIEIPVLGVESVPIEVAFSVEEATGRLLVEVDAYGVRDLVSSALGLIDVIVAFVLPLIGPFLSAALNDAVGDALAAASVAGIGPVQDAGVLPLGTTLTSVPGVPFRYRVTLPLQAPVFVQGSINELISTADGFALAGSWRVTAPAEREMDVDVSQFAWVSPDIPCGAGGEAALAAFDRDPLSMISLYAEIALTTAGTAPVRICGVQVLSGPGPAGGPQVSWTVATLPAVIEVRAPASLINAGMVGPLVVEVRTTSGVFVASIAPPTPPSGQDINRLRSEFVLHLRLCDAVVLPPWYNGEGHFDLEWIVDPLIDPERDWVIDIVELEVAGLSPGAWLSLDDPVTQAKTWARSTGDGVARISFDYRPGDRPPQTSVVLRERLPDHLRDIADPAIDFPAVDGRSLALHRLRLTGAAAIEVGSGASSLGAALGAGPGRFLLTTPEAVHLIDASEITRPRQAHRWRVLGARGALDTRVGVLAWGDDGVFRLEANGRERERLTREVATDATAAAGLVAAIIGNGVEVWNTHGAPLSRLTPGARPLSVQLNRNRLLVSTHEGLLVYDLTHPSEPRKLEVVDRLRGLRLSGAGMRSHVLAHQPEGGVLELATTERGLVPAAMRTTTPWEAGAVRSGAIVAHLGSRLTLFRLGGRSELSPG